MGQIYITASATSGKTGVCASRMWGNPALPEGFGYPVYTDNEGDDYPYFFICQINLAELAPYDRENRLPHAGLLSFFAKIDWYMGYDAPADCISGYISGIEDVKVLYFPDCANFREIVLVDDEGQPTSPDELALSFSLAKPGKYCDEHILFAEPDHREWETWDHPYEDWEILLQIDSFSGKDFNLNFMDCGVMDFLISPENLRRADFSEVRAIVLST
ncbi:MAG TPA: DUF1963 domain-containing protein [Candidatus Coprenecus stercoripullorum]|nr:DUF1963 domain-containing protein [Candidatus Coprenecus stercoripullorum]